MCTFGVPFAIMWNEQIEHSDGRVELAPGVHLGEQALHNEDLAPTTVAKRNWTTYNFAALWISMAHCTILLGNIIVLLPILANSHPGTKYGIPFPVFARAAYGVYGSNVPALMRALVACGWFGIQAWIGGEALHTFFKATIPGWQTALGGRVGGHTPTEWISFLLFWSLNIFIIY